MKQKYHSNDLFLYTIYEVKTTDNATTFRI